MIQTPTEFINYYDDLYKEGYMDEWEESKKNRISEILKSLSLPAKCKILDFGCGTGVFSNLIKSIYPESEVVGCEITDVALQIAKAKNKNCTFLLNEEVLKLKNTFDFVFSHHVLEHVPSIETTLVEISSVCKENAVVLHILPCGNIGSYEYNLTNCVVNGIDKNMGNRFYYEDPGHLRRLTSNELIAANNEHGFKIKSSFFANQYYGALSWIAKSNISNILGLTDYNKANSPKNKNCLMVQRFKLMGLFLLFIIPKYFMVSWHAKPKKVKHVFFIVFFLIPFLLLYPFFTYFNTKVDNEWTLGKSKENGSEMYLLFIR